MKELKQSILYDVEHIDKEIIDYGAHIAVEVHKVRVANDLLVRWIKEAIADREGEEGEKRAKLPVARSSTKNNDALPTKGNSISSNND